VPRRHDALADTELGREQRQLVPIPALASFETDKWTARHVEPAGTGLSDPRMIVA
jgi:hypothetical protein